MGELEHPHGLSTGWTAEQHLVEGVAETRHRSQRAQKIGRRRQEHEPLRLVADHRQEPPARCGRHLLEQPRLTDAGVAQDHRSSCDARARDQIDDLLELAATPDEGPLHGRNLGQQRTRKDARQVFADETTPHPALIPHEAPGYPLRHPRIPARRKSESPALARDPRLSPLSPQAP
jgi:hypothetical protein